MTNPAILEALTAKMEEIWNDDLSFADQAAAVLELVGPRELVFREEPRHGWKIGVSYAGPDAHIMRNDYGWQYKLVCYPSLEAAQAAAQAHADAAHWANTPLGKLLKEDNANG